MNTKMLAMAAMVSAMALSAATGALAKGHDQGFGAQLAGRTTAGLVDDGQTNRGGDGSATSYGKTDASLEAKAGEQGKDELAKARELPGHPSNK